MKDETPTRHVDKVRSSRHGRDGDESMITFGPTAMKALQLLSEAAQTGRRKFNDDAADLLADMASGQPLPVTAAMVKLSLISEEVGRLGDPQTSAALNLFRSALWREVPSPDRHPITVTGIPRGKDAGDTEKDEQNRR